MNSSAQILSHNVQGRVADGFACTDKRCGRNNHREDGHQLATTSNAVVDAHTPTTSVLHLADLADEKFGHDERVENIAASHSHSPSEDGNDWNTSKAGCTKILVAHRNFRFRAASCAVSEHSTRSTTAHRGVAA